MKYIALILLSFSLVSCVTKQLDSGLAGLYGLKIDTAVKALGVPSRSMEMDKENIYEWHYSTGGLLISPSVATTSGTIGGVPVSATTSYNTYTPTQLNARISLITNKKKQIVGSSYNGQTGALAIPNDILKPYRIEAGDSPRAMLKRIQQAQAQAGQSQ